MTSRTPTASDAHRTRDGRFRNPWPDDISQSPSAILRVVIDYWKRARNAPSWRNAFPTAVPAIAYPRLKTKEANATWIGHSTVLLQVGSLNVLTDPVFSARAFPVQWFGPRRVMDPALPLDRLPPIDVVLISHNHYDHLDRSAVAHIARRNIGATWIVPLGLAPSIRRWGVRQVIELDWWQETTIGSLRVTATPARHMSARGITDRNRSLWCGFALHAEDLRVFFAGDTAYHPEFGAVGERCGPFDFVMIPIAAYEPRWFMHIVHIDPEEAVMVYNDVASAHRDSAPLMLCVHWGTFPLTAEPMDEPPQRVAECWSKSGLDAARLWIPRCGETRPLTTSAK